MLYLFIILLPSSLNLILLIYKKSLPVAGMVVSVFNNSWELIYYPFFSITSDFHLIEHHCTNTVIYMICVIPFGALLLELTCSIFLPTYCSDNNDDKIISLFQIVGLKMLLASSGKSAKEKVNHFSSVLVLKNHATREPGHTAPPILPDVAREPGHTAPSIIPDLAREPGHTAPSIIPDAVREPGHTAPSIIPNVARESGHTAPPILPDVAREPRHTAPSIIPDVAREPGHTAPSIIPDLAIEPGQTVPPILPDLAREPGHIAPSMYST